MIGKFLEPHITPAPAPSNLPSRLRTAVRSLPLPRPTATAAVRRGCVVTNPPPLVLLPVGVCRDNKTFARRAAAADGADRRRAAATTWAWQSVVAVEVEVAVTVAPAAAAAPGACLPPLPLAAAASRQSNARVPACGALRRILHLQEGGAYRGYTYIRENHTIKDLVVL